MHMNARSHHTKSPKTNKQLPFSILSLHNAFITTTVVWKYFVVKKFSWVMEPTKIYYTNNF